METWLAAYHIYLNGILPCTVHSKGNLTILGQGEQCRRAPSEEDSESV